MGQSVNPLNNWLNRSIDFMNPFDGNPAPGAKVKPAYKPKYSGLTTGTATQAVGMSNFDPLNPGMDTDTLLGEGRPTMVETEGSDPNKPYTYKPSQRATTGGRGDTRTSPTNVKQTGTNMGAINMPELDMTGIANFAGPSFPTQPSTNKLSVNYANNNSGFNIEDGTSLGISPDAYQPQAFSTGEDTVPSFTSAMQAGKGNVPATFSADNYKMGGKFTGPPTPTQGLDQTPGKSGPIDEDMEFGTSNPMGYALDGEEMRRRSAFLDTPGGSMAGLRAVEAGMGIKYAGGNHYAHIDGKPVKMDSDGEFSARAIKNAAPGQAQALKDSFVSRIAATKNEEDVAQSTPDALQSPGVVGEVEGINSKMNVGKDKNKMNAGSFTSSGLDIPGISNTQGVSPAKFDASKFYLK